MKQFHPLRTVAGSPHGPGVILAGGPEGIYRARDEDGKPRYDDVSKREFLGKVTLPETWLFCSGEHEIEVVRSDEA